MFESLCTYNVASLLGILVVVFVAGWLVGIWTQQYWQSKKKVFKTQKEVDDFINGV